MKTALVTAGASGIGAAIAGGLQADGWAVHVCDIDESALEAFLEAHPGMTGTVADVSQPDAVQGAFDDLRDRHGRLDLLVNNAGISGPTAPVEDISPDDWRNTLAVDLDGAFFCARLAIPLLKESRGLIINMASSAGLFGYPHRSPYAAAKWGLIGFTKTLAMELGPFGVRANAICPGSVAGERIDQVIERDAAMQGKTPEAIRELYTSQVSLRCFIEPEEIAALVVFLASEAGAKISGQAIGLDGHTEGLSWR